MVLIDAITFIPRHTWRAMVSPFRQNHVSEMIGDAKRFANRVVNRQYSMQPTRDWRQADYRFWNRTRWGRAEGLEIAGLFIKPMASKIAAWSMGIVPQFKFEREKTQTLVSEWFAKYHADVLRAVEESLVLGDAYLVINADLSVTVVPPDVVEPIVDESDYSRIIGWRITEVHPHPTNVGDNMTIVDEYYANRRIRKITKNGAQFKTSTYRNLMGIIPVIHIANDVGSDETFGHPAGEALLAALSKYGIIFDAGIDGNKRQGRPTPVIEKMGTQQEIQAFYDRFGTKRTVTLDDGTTETYYEFDFDADKLLTLGADANFKYAQPGSFAGDTSTLLAIIFWLVLQHSEIPEFVWGNAISSSHASAEAQMPPFVKYIQKRQGQMEKWVAELVHVVVGYLSLWESGVVVEEDVAVKWASLTDKDGRLTLDAIKLATDKGLIDDETALGLMPLDIENPAEVLEKARQEEEERQAEYERRQEAVLGLSDNSPDDATDNNDNPDDDLEESGVDLFDRILEGMVAG